jgi:exodeoxyribonuclease V
MLNKQQIDALESLQKFLKSEEIYYYLFGDAGTGKSYTIAKILSNIDYYFESEIICLAPSHKAKKVLKKFLVQNDLTEIECKTIHSALGMVLKEDDDKGKNILSKNSKSENILDGKKLIIIDEISMIDENLVQELINQVSFSFIKKKVIFLGDIKQLPPINKMTFPLLEAIPSTSNNTSLLTEVMRYDNDEVMRYDNESLKNFLNKVKEVVSYNLEQRETKNFIEFSPYRLIPKNDENFYKISSYDMAIESFMKLRKKRLDVVALAFKNTTLERLQSSIRNEIFKGIFENDIPQYIPGEVYCCNEPIGMVTNFSPLQISSKFTFANGDLIQIVETKEITIEEKDALGDLNYFLATILTVKEFGGDENLSVEISVINDGEKFNKFLDSFKRAAAKAKKLGEPHGKFWQRFFYLKKLHSSIRIKEVLSIHKSQGSSYDYVYLFDDIKASRDNRKEAKDNFSFMQSRLWYVGASRAKKQLVIVQF